MLLPALFVGGYALFVTRWVPRIMLTLKARAWLTGYTRAAAAALTVSAVDPAGWPELTLAVAQFAGLIWVVTRVTLVAAPAGHLAERPGVTPAGVTPAGTAGVENFFYLWTHRRTTFLYAPAAAELTRRVTTLLGGFGTAGVPRQFPLLGLRLKKELTPLLSEPTPPVVGA